MQKKLTKAKRKLEDLQQLDPVYDPVGINEARKEVHLWLEREEMMWKQRSRLQWLKEGDQKTRFFHSQASQRRKRNMIKSLKNEIGVWLDGTQMDSLVINFSKLCLLLQCREVKMKS